MDLLRGVPNRLVRFSPWEDGESIPSFHGLKSEGAVVSSHSVGTFNTKGVVYGYDDQ